jgi:anti-anti-sigma regulatory factor
MIVNVVKGASIGSLFKANVEESVSGSTATLKLKGAFTFSNYLGLKKYILKHEEKSIILDLSEATMLDHSVIHHLHDFMHDQEVKELEFYFVNDKHLIPVSNHPLAERKVNFK